MRRLWDKMWWRRNRTDVRARRLRRRLGVVRDREAATDRMVGRR